ncbi:MAG TPA: TlpA disulfide reductase family protein [Candidatus Omnitrophota bacterium]|nr:TlpA disulfide reductase family protein [Candidatus Omnitrophota bacterium]HPD84323.1 TlpA disulfide reductase family protein [Candidatus Omnitrophota bacterium]HRZ03181.1 TlpA disulfide reductase family protein [Candidatus Omnitrophota bacterium]
MIARSFLRMCVLLFLVFIISPLSFGAGQMSFTDFRNAQSIGKAAEDFTLKDLSGADVGMTKYREGKKAVIFFWATWCPHCRVALQKLNQDRAVFEQKGIKLILVDIGEDRGDVQNYVSKNRIGINVFLDQDSTVAESYNVIGIPMFFFLNSQGIIQAADNTMPDNYEEILNRNN